MTAAPLALYYAAKHPEKVEGLVLVGAFARMTWSDPHITQLREYIRGGWGRGATVLAMFPEEQTSDPLVKAWAAEVERRGASPGAALDLLEMNLIVDATPVSLGHTVCGHGASPRRRPGHRRRLRSRSRSPAQ